MAQHRWAATGKILVALLVLAIIAIAAEIGLLAHRGISASVPPSAAEIVFARGIRHLAIPFSSRNLRNPLPLTPEVLREGRDHFADHCATCHANDGSGKTEMGPNFYPPVADLRRASTQGMSDGEIFYIIQNGVRLTAMPAFGDEHTASDNWKLVHFIRHLPEITPAELDEMKQMNPVSPHEMQEQKEDEEFLEGKGKHEGH